MKIRKYTQPEAILRTAFDIEDSSIKTVAEMTGKNRVSGSFCRHNWFSEKRWENSIDCISKAF